MSQLKRTCCGYIPRLLSLSLVGGKSNITHLFAAPQFSKFLPHYLCPWALFFTNTCTQPMQVTCRSTCVDRVSCITTKSSEIKCLVFFLSLGLARNTSALLSTTVVCNPQHTRNTNMASSPIVTANTSICSKCGRPPSQARYPLVECSQCSRLFHTTCLIKSYANKKQNLSCADCKKCMNASMRESTKQSE